MGGLLGVILLPIVLLLLIGVILVATVGSAVTNVASGGQIRYDEKVMQSYADAQYAAEFASVSASAYEDNLLIVIATNEEADQYYRIAWCGDNLRSEINMLFGNESTAFGRIVRDSINSEYYAYSLDSNLALVMNRMTDQITALDLPSSFQRQHMGTQTVSSHLTNHTELSLTEATVNAALEDFTEQTQIPAVIVVDTMENIFGKTLDVADIFTVIVLIVLLIVVICWLVRRLRRYRSQKGSDNNGNNQSNQNDRSYGGSYNQNEHRRNY